jgi:pyruvate dehydrogenase E2 component (dihydrolipoamide acetyltransferase)
MIEFKLPALGADVDQGKLLEWRIKPGDAVKRGQVVAVVDTSKAAIDVESWQEGRVYKLVTQADETIPVGTVMALLLEPGESAESAVAPAGATSGAGLAAPAAATAATTGAPQAPATAAVPGGQRAATAHAAAAQSAGAQPSGAQPASASAPWSAEAARVQSAVRRKISPAARRRAAELGVDVECLPPGTGPHGAVSIEDVERASRRQPASPQPVSAPAADRTAAMRATIAAAMSRSKREIPHYYLTDTVPLQRLLRWLEQKNSERPMTARLLSAVPLLKAVALSLREFPEFNGYYRDGGFRPAAAIHIGVAIALRQGGLIAPALHDVDAKTLDALMSDLADLIRRARAGSLRSSEMADPTVTVTNLGDNSVESVVGVIYPPQVALIGFGSIVERAWSVDGGLRSMPVIHVSLAADHRVSDGHRGARFLAALRERLQQPEDL